MARVVQRQENGFGANIRRGSEFVGRHWKSLVITLAIATGVVIEGSRLISNQNNANPENNGNSKPGLPAVVNREADPENEPTTLPTSIPSFTPSPIPPTSTPQKVAEQPTIVITAEPIAEPTKKLDVVGLETARKFIKESPGSPSIIERSSALIGTDLTVVTWVVDTRPGLFSAEEKLIDPAKNKIALDTARAIVPEIKGIKKVVVILLNAGDISMDSFMRLFPNSQDVSINSKSANERKVIISDGQSDLLIHIMNAPYLKIDPYKYYVNGLYEAYNTILATKYSTSLSAEQRAVLAGSAANYVIYRDVLNTH